MVAHRVSIWGHEGTRLGCLHSHDPLLHTSLRGPKRVGLVISNLNRVVTLVEGTSGGCEERYFFIVSACHNQAQFERIAPLSKTLGFYGLSMGPQ
jgi:hypothetical protein